MSCQPAAPEAAKKLAAKGPTVAAGSAPPGTHQLIMPQKFAVMAIMPRSAAAVGQADAVKRLFAEQTGSAEIVTWQAALIAGDIPA